MIIATIKKLDGTHLDHSKFESEEAAMAWFQPRIDRGIYGQKYVPSSDTQVLVQREIRDENNVVIQAAVYETIHKEEVPAAFSIELADEASIPKSQSEINIEALAFLSQSDWKVIKYRDQMDMGISPDLSVEEFQYLLAQRQQARDSISEA